MSFKLEYLCKIEFTFITNLRCEPGDQAGSIGGKNQRLKNLMQVCLKNRNCDEGQLNSLENGKQGKRLAEMENQEAKTVGKRSGARTRGDN